MIENSMGGSNATVQIMVNGPKLEMYQFQEKIIATNVALRIPPNKFGSLFHGDGKTYVSKYIA